MGRYFLKNNQGMIISLRVNASNPRKGGTLDKVLLDAYPLPYRSHRSEIRRVVDGTCDRSNVTIPE
jgi:hypothetical protein